MSDLLQARAESPPGKLQRVTRKSFWLLRRTEKSMSVVEYVTTCHRWSSPTPAWYSCRHNIRINKANHHHPSGVRPWQNSFGCKGVVKRLQQRHPHLPLVQPALTNWGLVTESQWCNCSIIRRGNATEHAFPERKMRQSLHLTT
jgi:hypothetical protein